MTHAFLASNAASSLSAGVGMSVNTRLLFSLLTAFLSICRVPLRKVGNNDFLDMYRATLVNLKNKYAPGDSPEPLTDYKDVCCGVRTVQHMQHVSSLAHNVMCG